ncbi:hypothetical protein ACROYT_G034417 [Oculina patagonica]
MPSSDAKYCHLMTGLFCIFSLILSNTESSTYFLEEGALSDTLTHKLAKSTLLRNLESYSRRFCELATSQHSVGLVEGDVGQEDSTACLSLRTTSNLALNLFETSAAKRGMSALPSTASSLNCNLSKCS